MPSTPQSSEPETNQNVQTEEVEEHDCIYDPAFLPLTPDTGHL